MRIGPKHTWEDDRLKQGVHMDGEMMTTTRGPTWRTVADSLLRRASAGGSGHEDMNMSITGAPSPLFEPSATEEINDGGSS
jgi:hypothetical protein